MGTVPPPPRLSREEFARRWNAGARTFAEIDPEFVAWAKRPLMMMAVTLTLGSVLWVFMIISLAVKWGM